MSALAPNPQSRRNGAADVWILWFAQGFGSGRLRPGPGTWGSAVGLAMAWPLLHLPSFGQWVALMALTVASVWICAQAERILGEEDPGSVVLDEIVAVLWVLATLRWLHSLIAGIRETLAFTFVGVPLSTVLVAWVAFRVMDIGKPWPVGVSQNLPGGWGVVADDLLAAVYAVGVAAIWEYWIR